MHYAQMFGPETIISPVSGHRCNSITVTTVPWLLDDAHVLSSAHATNVWASLVKSSELAIPQARQQALHPWHSSPVIPIGLLLLIRHVPRVFHPYIFLCVCLIIRAGLPPSVGLTPFNVQQRSLHSKRWP
jgi:hypothetical protein